MPSEYDIVVSLRLSGDDGIEPNFLVKTLDNVETALYQSDRRDVEEAARALDLPAFVRDASLERLRHHRHKRLRIERASTGSVQLDTVVLAVSLFVLQTTVGEAFKEAAKTSQTYEAIREFFRRNLDRKVSFIADAVRRSLDVRRQQASVSRVDLNVVLIHVRRESPPNQPRSPGSIGELLE
jgi:hypothetical protein